MYFLKYFCAKFCEILISDSWEIGIFPRQLLLFQSQSFDLQHMCCIDWVLYVHTFSKHTFVIRLKPSMHCVQLWRKIAQIHVVWAMSKWNDSCIEAMHVYLQSLCTCWIASVRVCTKTVFGHLNSHYRCLVTPVKGPSLKVYQLYSMFFNMRLNH